MVVAAPSGGHLDSMAVSRSPLTEEALRILDSQYEPFPSFSKWPDALPSATRWENSGAEIATANETATPEELKDAFDYVMRAAALDTGAIEGLYSVDRGFTLTVAASAAALELVEEKRGADVAALFEAQLRTYEIVLDVATKRLPVTEAWIRTLHKELCAPQKTYIAYTADGARQELPLPKGQYKTNPNHVELADGSRHAYASVTDTPAEMGRLLRELSSKAFAAAHPVLQASYVHYALVAIHPFADGNGRVARALASVYLYRGPGVPLLMFEDQRDAYFDALHSADSGTAEPLVRFFFDAAVAAMSLVAEVIRTSKAPKPEAELAALRRLLTTQRGLTHAELDAAAHRFTEFAVRVFEDVRAGLTAPPGIELGLNASSYRVDREGTFRPVQPEQTPSIVPSVRATAPTAGGFGWTFYVLVSTEQDESETFALVGVETGERLVFTLSDMEHGLAAAAEQRLRALATRTYGALLADLAGHVERAVRDAGYL